MMETHRANLELCAKVEADLAVCAPLVQYRTAIGVRRAYYVFVGILNRSSVGVLEKTNANAYLSAAKAKYNQSRFRESYGFLCQAYAAL